MPETKAEREGYVEVPVDPNKSTNLPGTDIAERLEPNVTQQATTTTTSGGGFQSYTNKSYSLTTIEEARAAFKKEMVDTYGYYDPKMFTVFYKQLRKLEKKYATVQVTRPGGGTTKAYGFSAATFVQDYVKGLAPAVVKAGKFGGLGRKYLDEIATNADKMGLRYSDSSLMKEALAVTKGEKTLDDVFTAHRKSAINLYTGFADRLKEDPKLSIRDLAEQHIGTMAALLEVDEDTIKLTNPILQGALTAIKDNKPYIKPLNEFVKDIKATEAWSFTNNAKNEAVELAQSFKSAFGFGG